MNQVDALAVRVLSGHAADELPNERGHAHGCPVRGHGRVLVRRVGYQHLRAIIGRVTQRPPGFLRRIPFDPTWAVCT